MINEIRNGYFRQVIDTTFTRTNQLYKMRCYTNLPSKKAGLSVVMYIFKNKDGRNVSRRLDERHNVSSSADECVCRILHLCILRIWKCDPGPHYPAFRTAHLHTLSSFPPSTRDVKQSNRFQSDIGGVIPLFLPISVHHSFRQGDVFQECHSSFGRLRCCHSVLGYFRRTYKEDSEIRG